MSDWHTSNEIETGLASRPKQYAVPNILGGNYFQFKGGKNAYAFIKKNEQEGKMIIINILEYP